VSTNQDPAAFATWSLGVPQGGQTYDLFVFIPAPALQETQPRTTRALYEIRSPGGGVTQFLLNQAVTTSQWIWVPTSSLTFASGGSYQLVLSGKTSDTPGTRAVVAGAVRLVPGSGTGTPGGGTSFPQLEEAQAQRAFELINQLRFQASVAPLNRSAALDAAERGHILDMITNNFLSSDGTGGVSASARASRRGYNPEILTIWISVGEATAEELLRDFPREILDPIYTDVGIAHAFAPGSPHVYYWSVVVAKRSPI
jgi:uncharacterized protein YkwD